MRALGIAAAAAQLAICGIGPAHAQPAPDQSREPSAWWFSLTVNGWLPGLGGTISTPLPRVGDRGFDLGSGAVISDLSTVPVMATGEARYERFALIGDIFHAGLERDFATRDALFQGGHARVVGTVGTILATIRVVETPRQSLEVGAGTRIWNFNTKLSLDPGLLPGTIQKTSTSWADPLIAARFHADFTPHFGVSVYGDVGGFGAGSQMTWQAIGSLDYRLTDRVTARAGWRYLSVDRSRAGFSLDLGFNGPSVAATFGF
jgi:hypothetical protein